MVSLGFIFKLSMDLRGRTKRSYCWTSADSSTFADDQTRNFPSGNLEVTRRRHPRPVRLGRQSVSDANATTTLILLIGASI